MGGRPVRRARTTKASARKANMRSRTKMTKTTKMTVATRSATTRAPHGHSASAHQWGRIGGRIEFSG
eukprot:622259-Prorocentrum_minimum.AAC.1